MSLKKIPLKIAAMIALSATLLVACDDTRVRVSAETNGGHSHGSYATHTQHNQRVSYDSELGMYIVLGLSNTYWNGNDYYRYHNHGWQSSRDYRRWNNVNITYIPNRLHKRHYREGGRIRDNRYRDNRYRDNRHRNNRCRDNRRRDGRCRDNRRRIITEY